MNSLERPQRKASVFKVSHHGSSNADCLETWDQLLVPEPKAILAPWRRGPGSLPGKTDVQRILSHTPHAYASSGSSTGTVKRSGIVAKAIRESGAGLRRASSELGMIRLRRSLANKGSWRVCLYGSACHLRNFAA